MAQKQKSRVKEHQAVLDEPESSIDEYRRQAVQQFEQHPVAVTLGAFGLGIGLGAMIGAALAGSRSSRVERTAESIGRRVLDSISDLLPNSLRS
jgi:hypothetical protein